MPEKVGTVALQAPGSMGGGAQDVVRAAGAGMRVCSANRIVYDAPAVAFASIGCRTNQEEMASLRAALSAGGYRVVERIQDADTLIFNTCTVTARAEAQARRMIRSVSASMPHVKILVTGCLAQQKPQAVAQAGGVRWVVGTALKHDIPRILAQEEGGVFAPPPSGRGPLMAPRPPLPPGQSARTRFAVKIQEGCDFRCAYCIVPAVRGPSRSADARAVVDAARRAIDAGYREVVLTGTHIGQYRSDNAGLAELLERLVRLPGDFRVRLSSLDPRDLTEGLIALICAEERICDHVHLSVQSLSDSVLERMGRGQVRVDEIARRAHALRAARACCSLGGDFIVGFPGETSEMFAETMANLASIGFACGHVFRYSPRAGTPASDMPCRIPASEARDRSRALRHLLGEQRRMFIDSMRNRPVRILVEQEEPAAGLTSNYIRVVVPRCRAPNNSWLTVRITGLDGRTDLCTGEVCG